MDYDEKVELSRNYFNSLSKSVERNVNNSYKPLAKNFDEVMIETGYHVPLILGEMCLKYISDKSENAQVLDIASGTGLVAETLYKGGFKGKIDGIDACKEMIEKSIEKKLYRTIQVQLITEQHPLPFPESTYEGAVCGGGFTFGHIPHACIYDMFRVLKQGGILLFNVSKLDNDPGNEILPSMEKIIQAMVDDGRCEIVETNASPTLMAYNDKQNTIYYCLRKLRHF